MKKVFFRALNIEAGEEERVLLLLAQSFFLGIFMATFETSASTMFLKIYGESMLSKAFLVSGAAGIILTTIYSKLQSKISFSRLAIINLVVVTVLILAMRIGFELTHSNWIVFTVFLMSGPLNVISMLGFWGLAGRVFTLRQSKRLFGMIDSGLVFGMILISFAVPLILAVMPEVKDLLIISAASSMFALLLQFVISNKYGKEIVVKETKSEANTMKISDLFKNRYIVLMASFVTLSMLGAFFVHYSYLVVIKEKYPEEQDLAKFFGFFTATIMIFSFVFKTFIYSKLMQTYGLRTSLLILPFLLIFFTVIAVLFGSFLGYQGASSGFVFFFLFIALNKLFSQSLRGSIELPAFKTLYQPLDKNIRYDVQAKIDGVVNEFSAFFSGLVLLILGSFEALKLIHFSYVQIILMSGWAFVTFKLYKEYKDTLKKSLSDIKRKGQSNAQNTILNHEVSEVLKKQIKSEQPDKIIYSLKVTEDMEPLLHEKSIIENISNNSSRISEYSINKIEEQKIYAALPSLKQQVVSTNNPSIQSLLKKTIAALDTPEEFFTLEKLAKLAKSRNSDEREYAAKIIGRLNNRAFIHLHLDLLKDAEPKVRIAAICSAAKVNHTELLTLLIDNLSSPTYESAATSSLVELGDKGVDVLDQAFYKSGLETSTLLRIINIYGLIKGEKAIHHLISKITFPDKKVSTQALLALRTCNYQASENVINRIFQTIETTIGNAAWNIAAISEIEHQDVIEKYLNDALQEELKNNFEYLYLLLSLLYDPQSIASIRENIESGTPEGIGFAIELLDLFLAEELKPKLFPLLEDVPLSDKLDKLQVHFPRESLSKKEVLKHIINRDYNQINRWTKACAIYAMPKMKNPVVSDDLIANLFNPDELLRETAAWIIFKLDPKTYELCVKRLSNDIKQELGAKIESAQQNKNSLLIERIFALRQITSLSSISNLVLTEIGKKMELKIFDAGKVLFKKENKLLQPLYFLERGKVLLIDKKGTNLELKTKLVGEMLILDSDDSTAQIVVEEQCVLHEISPENKMTLMYDFKEFAEVVLNNINERLGVEKVEVEI